MRRQLEPADEFDTSDQYTTLLWRFTERRDGETALFEVCGLRVWVHDLDGDFSEWSISKGKSGPVLAQGFSLEGNHFFACLREAEAALRRIITDRIAELRARSPLPAAQGGR